MLGDNLWSSAQQGINSDQSIIQNSLLNQANAARVAAYGPMAGNPEAALESQQYNYLQGLNPLRTQALANSNMLTGAQGQVAQGTIPSTIAATNAQNSGIVQTEPYVVQQSGAAASSATSAAKTASLGADAQAGVREGVGGSTFATAAAAYRAANPNDPEGAFNAGLQALKIASPDLAAQYAQPGGPLHQSFLANPDSVIDTLKSASAAHLAAQMSNLTVPQRIEMMKSNADLQKLGDEHRTAAQKFFTDTQSDYTEKLAKQGPLGASIVQADRASQNIEQMKEILKDVPNNTTVAALSEHIPGSKVQQLMALAKGTGAAFSVDMLAGLRQAGNGSGIRGTNTEFQAVGESLANIDPTLTKAQLMSQLASASATAKAFHDSAEGFVTGPNGPAEMRNAAARLHQAEQGLNYTQGIFPDASAAPATAPAKPAAAAPAGSTSNASTAKDFLADVESGNRNISQQVEDKNSKAGNPGEGYAQIIPPTWRLYAPAAGIDLKKFPTPMSASRDDQLKVASLIPLNQFGPRTQEAFKARYPGVDLATPIGSIDTHYAAAPGSVPPPSLGAGSPAGPAVPGTPSAATVNPDNSTGPSAKAAPAASGQQTSQASPIPSEVPQHVATALDANGRPINPLAKPHEAVMAGRALLAKYLPRIA